MEGSPQLSCSVKEEPDADGQEMGESGSHIRSRGFLDDMWTSLARVGDSRRGCAGAGGFLGGM